MTKELGIELTACPAIGQNHRLRTFPAEQIEGGEQRELIDKFLEQRLAAEGFGSLRGR